MISYFEKITVQREDIFVICGKCKSHYFFRLKNEKGMYEATTPRFCPACGQPGGHVMSFDEFKADCGE